MPRRHGQKKGRAPAHTLADGEDIRDDIEKHADERAVRMVGGQGDDSSSDDSAGEEVVMDMAEPATSDSDSDTDYDWDNEEDDDAKQRDIDNIAKAWGKKRSAYYQEGDVLDEAVDSEEEAEVAAAEEAEAKRLAAQHLSSLQEADFGIPSAAASSKGSAKKQSKGSSKRAGGVEKVSRRTGGLTQADKLDLVLSDAPELLGVLEELGSRVEEVRHTIQPILQAVREGGLATTGGVAYLEVRHQLLLAYVSHLAFYLMLKAEGAPVRHHPVMARLVRIRTMMEKARPLDAKLKFQLDRILRAGSGAQQGSVLAPNPTAMLAHGDDGASSDSSQSDAASSVSDAEPGASDGEEVTGTYKPLKRTAVMYDGEEGAEGARAARNRQKLLASRLYADLRSEFSERPEEQMVEGARGLAARGAGLGQDVGGELDAKLAKLQAAREAAEEENFSRLQESKEERRLRKARDRARARTAALGDVEDFATLQSDLGSSAGKAAALPGAKFGAPTLDWQAASASSLSTKQGGRSLSEYMSQVAAAAAGGGTALGGIARKRRRGELPGADAGTKRSRGASEEDVGGAAFDEAELEAMLEAGHASAARKSAAKTSRGQARVDALRAAAAAADSDEEAESKRLVTRDIMKNRGLTKYRKKSARNPRVAYREKADKRSKRYKNQVAPMRTAEAGRYAGEATGIRASISRSTKL
ncbi:ngdn [Symbiodinium sp. KB8]|nr:ngdn [Symbiodinium sp. KB8]